MDLYNPPLFRFHVGLFQSVAKGKQHRHLSSDTGAANSFLLLVAVHAVTVHSCLLLVVMPGAKNSFFSLVGVSAGTFDSRLHGGGTTFAP